MARSQLDRIRACYRDGGTTPAASTPPPIDDPTGSVPHRSEQSETNGHWTKRRRSGEPPSSIWYAPLGELSRPTQSEPPSLTGRNANLHPRNQPSARMEVLRVFRLTWKPGATLKSGVSRWATEKRCCANDGPGTIVAKLASCIAIRAAVVQRSSFRYRMEHRMISPCRRKGPPSHSTKEVPGGARHRKG